MGKLNDDIFIIFSSCCLGKKWVLNFRKNIMNEIIFIAAACFFITLFGLALGFLLLQVQAKS